MVGVVSCVLCVVRFLSCFASNFHAIDARALRLALNGFFEACDLVLRTISEHDAQSSSARAES